MSVKTSNISYCNLIVTILIGLLALITFTILSGPPVSILFKLIHLGVKFAGLFGQSQFTINFLNSFVPMYTSTNGEFVDGYKSMDHFIHTRWNADPYPNHQVRVRVYIPQTKKQKLPLMIWIHGGGFSFGSLEIAELTSRKFAKSGIIVVSAGYRHAYQHPFPTQLEDVHTLLKWLNEHASNTYKSDHNEEIKRLADFNKVIIAGESAGGNLALVSTLIAKERELKNLNFVHMMLYYPWMLYHSKTASGEEFKDTYIIPRWVLDWFAKIYTSNNTLMEHPYVCPLKAKSLNIIKHVSLFTAQYDPLRDEGRLLKAKMEEDGVNVMYREYPNTAHGFFSIPWVKEGEEAFQHSIQDINHLLV